jgi:hypothetical protein
MKKEIQNGNVYIEDIEEIFQDAKTDWNPSSSAKMRATLLKPISE